MDIDQAVDRATNMIQMLHMQQTRVSGQNYQDLINDIQCLKKLVDIARKYQDMIAHE